MSIKNGKLVFIKYLGIYGKIKRSWKVLNNGKYENNYIIEDMIGIEHEYFENEIEEVDDVSKTLEKAQTNAPLEMLIDKINKIDKGRNGKLIIEISKDKENCHSDIVVPYICIRYVNKYEDDKTYYIKNGKLYIPEDENKIANGKDEYECCIWCYDTDLKSMIFELYMNMISRLKY